MSDDSQAQAILVRLATPPYPDDPYPLYAELRSLGPVHHSDTGMAFVTSYEGCSTVLRSSSFGQGENASRLRLDPRFGHSAVLQTLSRMVTFVDPPEHTRLRRLVSRAFTPRSVEQLRGYIGGVLDGLLEPVEERGSGDLVGEYANHIPVTVVCHLLGVPHEDHGLCYDWAEDIALSVEVSVTDEAMARADRAAASFEAYLQDLVKQRRAHPADDLLSALIAAREADDRFTEDELISMAIELIGAGFETTRNLIGSGLLALLRQRSQWQRLREDPALIRSAVEEFLRYEPPVQTAVPRFALDDVDIDGVAVARGTILGPMIGAANRDPRRFCDPEQLDIGRPDNQPLTFAPGIHYCLGANVARLEGELAIATIVERYPDLELAGAAPMRSTCALGPNPRGPLSLPVSLGR